ncbi:MAG: hypothetical protein DRI89_03325 [Bacteroidetes bacterium]|nr:MAG: hypothetical protein DRI89_03325 [Bacteroidota bacterium]
MNNITRALIFVFISALFISQLNAEEYKYGNNKKSSKLKQTTAGCAPAAGFDWLDINNVRGRVNTGGDMWWDLPGGVGAKYFIPANGTATSLFAGALWIGGLDINNQLKLAAQKFRQNGIDYWTGPLTVDGTAAISAATCAEYDKFFKITRQAVDDFLSHTNPETGAFEPSDDYTIPPEILKWPAHGDVSKGQSYYLAPFYDVNDDGYYEPEVGDYPYYDVKDVLCHTDLPTMEEVYEGTVTHSILADQVIKGDQTLWWVFNDKGDIHTETDGSAIGMEIRAQAFAFATNDVINDMTFYSYEIINRSTFELTKTFFSPWVDPDLGFASDDFVGCDVGRGLGYCYNGTAIDGSGDVMAYGEQPPAIGVDFFQGPYLDPDGLDNPKYDIVVDGANGDTSLVQRCDVSINGVNFGNTIVDDERYGMRRFVYYNNSNSNTIGEPGNAPDYYNYLRGIWLDGTNMLYGGNGHVAGSGTVGPDCDFMFPGDSDPCNWGTQGAQPNGGFNQDGFYWTEETGNGGTPNPPGDRRFMQSAGPFTLMPGAVNYITVGIPWARATAGGPFASVEKLRVVDDKCQALFDNCFKVIDGPSAPDLTVRELDKALIIYISNSPTSNNYKEAYVEYDRTIIQPNPANPDERSDSLYRFEGYQIFQLKNKEVSIGDLGNVDLMRVIAQYDKKNGITKIVNYYQDDFIGAAVPVVEVVGGDNGIEHSFMLTQDAFATKDVRLVNNKVYYFLAIAYAYNNYLDYGPGPDNYQGQTKPYLSGRKNIPNVPYSGMPHKIVNGTVINGGYGDSPPMTRAAGNGNGGLNIDLTDETIEEILSKPPAGPDNLFGAPDYPIAYNGNYIKNGSPINISIIDPLQVVAGNYTWWMDTLFAEKLYNVTGRVEVDGDTTSKMVGNWFIVNNETGNVKKSDTTIIVDNEQLYLDLGFSVNVLQPFYPGPIEVGTVRVNSGGVNEDKSFWEVLADNNGLLQANMVFSDSSNRWLSGIEDQDIPGNALDWIRSGTHKEADDNGSPANDDWNMTKSAPPNPWDPGEVYEQMIDGTWTPYGLTAYANNTGPFDGDNQNEFGPAFDKISKLGSKLADIASVDIVLTPDKTKWTRTPVLEMGIENDLVQGGVNRFALRASPSVDKDGNFATIGSGPSENENDPNYISDHSMGWFPGYCINIETGERLNILFGENSYLVAQNGRDMLFNPPAKNMDLADQREDPNIFIGPMVPGADPYALKVPVMGGEHYVYIQAHKKEETEFGYDFDIPAYDAGRYSIELLDTIFETSTKFALPFFYSSFMYVGMPMGIEGREWLSDEVKIRIRIAKPFERGYSSVPLDTIYEGMDFNNFYPAFDFSMDDMATGYNVEEKQQSDLDLINIVPNPYYAYSAYEHNALDTRVKITNLPKNCKIIIFDVAGVKVREFTKDSQNTTLEWDLKNFAGVPTSGGVYYIHVKSDEGERVLKWFSIQRVPDLNTF